MAPPRAREHGVVLSEAAASSPPCDVAFHSSEAFQSSIPRPTAARAMCLGR